MSVILIAILILVLLGLHRRMTRRARSAIRAWALAYGYRVESMRFESAFDDRYRVAGRTAEIVYRFVVWNEAGERHEGRALLRRPLFGRLEIEVRWVRPDES